MGPLTESGAPHREWGASQRVGVMDLEAWCGNAALVVKARLQIWAYPAATRLSLSLALSLSSLMLHELVSLHPNTHAHTHAQLWFTEGKYTCARCVSTLNPAVSQT